MNADRSSNVLVKVATSRHKRDGLGNAQRHAIGSDAALKVATCITHAAEPPSDAVAL